jgi:hypothetical protein
VNLTLIRHPSRDVYEYRLRIDGGELMRAKLYPFDRALLRDIETSDDVTVADQLLGLEMLARRIEESRAGEGT